MMTSSIDSIPAQNKTRLSPGKYRPEIDGLRAFAVVAVIINHFNKDLLPSGYLGVDIFFVISGYVITSSLAGRTSKNFLDFLSGFYERRIKRLVPALVIFVTITCVLISLFNTDPKGSLELGIKALFGVSNISLYRASTDYFAESTELNPFTHTWSLGVEEQFYLLFPFLIWFSGFGKQAANGARNLFFWVGVLTIASLMSFIYLYRVNQPAAYFLMPPRFWEMAAGCLVFIGFQKRAKLEQVLEKIPPFLIVAAMVGTLFLPVGSAVPATLGIVVLSAILLACLKQGTAAFQFFTQANVVFIGLISYSLYLWHWVVLCISRWTIGIHIWSVPIQVGLMLVMAASSYRFLESPIRKSNFKQRSDVLILGLGTLFIAGTFGFLLTQLKSRLFIGSTTDTGETKIRRYLKPHMGSQYDRLIKECLSAPQPAQSGLAGTTKLTPEFKRNCLSLSPDRTKPLVAFIGDSHVGSLIPSVKRLRGEGFSTFFHGRPGCIYPYPEQTVQGCKETMDITTEFLMERFKGRGGGIIIIDNYYQGHFGEDGHLKPQFRDRDTKTILNKFSKAVESLAAKVSTVNGKVILITPKPDHMFYAYSFDPSYSRCNPQWFSKLNQQYCPGDKDGTMRGAIELETTPILQSMIRAKLKSPNLALLNLFDVLCDSKTKCKIFRNGRAIYTDSNHLSTHGGDLVYPKVKEEILRSWLEKNSRI